MTEKNIGAIADLEGTIQKSNGTKYSRTAGVRNKINRTIFFNFAAQVKPLGRDRWRLKL